MLDKKITDKVRKLKQDDSVWVCALRTMTPSKAPARQVQVLMVLNTEDMALRKMHMVVGVPNIDELAEEIAKAMYAPQAEATGLGGLLGPKLPKHRPSVVLFEDERLLADIAPMLQDQAIEVRLEEHFEPLDDMMQMFAKFAGMSGLDLSTIGDEEDLPPPPDHRVGLLEIPGISEPLVRELFEHAAQFYRLRPWDSLDEEDIFRMQYGALGQPQREYIVSVMGMGGMEFGLALYDSVADLNETLAMEDPEDAELARAIRSMSLTYVDKDDMLPADVAAQKKYRWDLSNKKLYPLLFRYAPEAGMTSPAREDIGAISAMLQMLPGFIDTHLIASEEELANGAETDDEKVTQTFELSPLHAGAVLTVSYPVDGVIFPEGQDLDWLFDDGDTDEDDG